MDPSDLLGLGGNPVKQCAIRALSVNVAGQGAFRLELADAQRKVVWKAALTLEDANTKTYEFPICLEQAVGLKFMNWIAEPGCELRLSSIGFLADRPEMPIEEWASRSPSASSAVATTPQAA